MEYGRERNKEKRKLNNTQKKKIRKEEKEK
jgi:hypothetical protein